MYAIIKNGGKQYRVSEGDIVLFDKMSLEAKASVEFKEVLMIGYDVPKIGGFSIGDGSVIGGKEPKIGTPLVSGAVVKGEVINEGRAAKVITFKKRRRKDSKVKRGFRRDFTRVRIVSIAA